MEKTQDSSCNHQGPTEQGLKYRTQNQSIQIFFLSVINEDLSWLKIQEELQEKCLSFYSCSLHVLTSHLCVGQLSCSFFQTNSIKIALLQVSNELYFVKICKHFLICKTTDLSETFNNFHCHLPLEILTSFSFFV